MLGERQRREYLQAMGVECLEPRLRLPGARLSELLPEQDRPVHAAASIPAAAEAPAPAAIGSGAAAAQDLLGGLSGATKPTMARTRAASPAPLAPSQEVRFALSVVRAGHLLLVDDGLPAAIDPAVYLTFIRNMVFALGARAEVPTVDAFIWPLPRVKAGRVDRSEDAARQVLRAYINKQLEQASAGHVLLMGETAQRYLQPQSADFSDGLSAVTWTATTSAIAALASPQQKAALWRQLRPVADAIGQGS